MIIVLSISFVFTSTLSAQGIGIKGGLNLGKFNGEDVKDISDELDEKLFIGYSGGAFVSLPIGNVFSLRPEILFTNNGANFESSEDGLGSKMAINLNWLNIPVLLVLNLTPNIRVFGGPYFDIFLNGTMKLEISYEGESFDEEEDIGKDEITSLAYGAIAGAAIGIGKRMDLEIRYSRGINTLDTKPDDWDDSFGEYDKADFKPSMIQVMLNLYLLHK